MKIWIVTLFLSSALAAPSFEVHHRKIRSVGSLFEDSFDEPRIREEKLLSNAIASQKVVVKSLKEPFSIKARGVGDFLEKLIEESGLKDLLPWIREMFDTDPDIQDIVEFLKSDAFDRIEEHLKQCPSYEEVKDKLLEEGIDLPQWAEAVRHFIGGSSYRRNAFYYKIHARRTLAELLDTIMDKLDVSTVIDTIHEKFHGDPDLRNLVDFLKSQNFVDINLCMRENADVQELLQKLRDEGIDVDSFIDMIKTILGAHVY